MTIHRDGKSLDAYLLHILCLLITEQSVSRVALRMNQSQPAISAALKRLRDILGDPLLVREKNGMVPTERALALLPHAKNVLAEMDNMIRTPAEFQPQDCSQTFRIGSPDYMTPSFMANAVQTLRQKAPNVRLMTQLLGPGFDFEQSLAEGELDIVIGNWPEPPQRMHLSTLLEDEIVCLVSARHPLVQEGMTYENYLKYPHIVPLPYAVNQKGLIDSTLASQGINRSQCVMVQSFMTAPYLLEHTDLIFTITRHFAGFYANILDLAILPVPISFPAMKFYLLWHQRNHKSPAHRWIRNILLDCGRGIDTHNP